MGWWVCSALPRMRSRRLVRCSRMLGFQHRCGGYVPAEAMEVDALAQDGAADQDFGEHGTAVREHESFAGLALGVPVDHARPETRGRPAVLRGRAFARPAFGAYVRSLGTSHLSLRQTPKVRTSVTCCVHLLDRPANPLPNGAACVIERDAGTPEHGRKGIESGSDGVSAWARLNLERWILRSQRTRGLSLRLHLGCEPSYVVTLRQGRNSLRTENDVRRILEMSNECRRIDGLVPCPTPQRVKLLDESHERINATNTPGTVLVKVTQLPELRELFVNERRHVSRDERIDARTSDLE